MSKVSILSPYEMPEEVFFFLLSYSTRLLLHTATKLAEEKGKVGKKVGFHASFLFSAFQKEGVQRRPSTQCRPGNRVLRPGGAQALHHPVSRPSPLQHIQVRRSHFCFSFFFFLVLTQSLKMAENL